MKLLALQQIMGVTPPGKRHNTEKQIWINNGIFSGTTKSKKCTIGIFYGSLLARCWLDAAGQDGELADTSASPLHDGGATSLEEGLELEPPDREPRLASLLRWQEASVDKNN